MKPGASIGALVALVGILTAVGCGGSSPSSSSQGGTPSVVNIAESSGPFLHYWARDQNYYQQAFPGVKFNIREFDAGRDEILALAAGSMDLALGIGPAPTATAILQHVPVKFIWNGGVDNTEAIVAKQPISSVAELKGKRIAYVGNSAGEFNILGALTSAGISQTDVRLIDMPAGDMVAAWRRGDIDAASTWSPFAEAMIATGGTVLLRVGDLAKAGYPQFSSGLAATAFLNKYTDFVAQLMVKVWQRANDAYEKDPVTVCADVSKANGLQPTELCEAMKLTAPYPGVKDQLTASGFGTDGHSGQMLVALVKQGQFLYKNRAIGTYPDQATLAAGIDPRPLQKAQSLL